MQSKEDVFPDLYGFERGMFVNDMIKLEFKFDFTVRYFVGGEKNK